MVNKGQKPDLYHWPQRDKSKRINFNPWLLRFAIIYPTNCQPEIKPLNYCTLFFVTEEATTNILNVIKWSYSWGKPRKLQPSSKHGKLSAATEASKMSRWDQSNGYLKSAMALTPEVVPSFFLWIPIFLVFR